MGTSYKWGSSTMQWKLSLAWSWTVIYYNPGLWYLIRFRDNVDHSVKGLHGWLYPFSQCFHALQHEKNWPNPQSPCVVSFCKLESESGYTTTLCKSILWMDFFPRDFPADVFADSLPITVNKLMQWPKCGFSCMYYFSSFPFHMLVTDH